MEECTIQYHKELFRYTCVARSKFSADGRYLAVAQANKVVIRDAQSLETVSTFAAPKNVQILEWSPNARQDALLLVGSPESGVLHVLGTDDATPLAEIAVGAAGLQAAQFAPDGAHVVVLTQQQVNVSVYSLVTGAAVMRLDRPKIRVTEQGWRGLHFSHSGEYVAIAQRVNSKDVINVLDMVGGTPTWELALQVEVECVDMADFVWSPDDHHLTVWGDSLEYSVEQVALFRPSADGQTLLRQRYSAYEHTLGVKSVAWAPTTLHVAVGSYDDVVRLLHPQSLQPTAELIHSTRIDEQLYEPDAVDPWVVYNEIATAAHSSAPLHHPHVNKENSPSAGADEETTTAAGKVEAPSSSGRAYDVRIDGLDLTEVAADTSEASVAKHGVGMLRWNSTGGYLATHSARTPHTVWIWDATRGHLVAALQHLQPVTDFQWHPSQPLLAIATGGAMAYYWTPAGAFVSPLPTSKAAFQAPRWSVRGDSLLLLGKNHMICSFPQIPLSI